LHSVMSVSYADSPEEEQEQRVLNTVLMIGSIPEKK
jgi:hypothetical protein